MAILVLVVFASLAISAVCSLFEATLYSTRISALESAREEPARRRVADRFLEMKRDIAVPTSAILILNTFANTAGATIAGVYAAKVFGSSNVATFSIVLTVSILFLAEILPKTVAATRWRKIWPNIVYPLLAMQLVLYPLIVLTQWFARLFTGPTASPSVSQDEVVATIRMGAQSGALTREEWELLGAVFDFEDVTCQQVQLPRNEIVWLNAQEPVQDLLQQIRETRHTRYPIAKNSLDEAFGIVHIKDLVGLGSDEISISDIARPLAVVPETMFVRNVLSDMRRSKQHMAIVVDEYGTTTGLVTLELIVEQIIGPVEDEFDDEATDIAEEPEGGLLVKGTVTLKRLQRENGIYFDAAPGINTLSGWVVSQLGRLPILGEHVPFKGGVVTVAEISDSRVELARIVEGGGETKGTKTQEI